MKLIDVDAAIGGVKNRCLGQNDVVKVEHSIISMLYMMPTIEIEPQWIPCSDRLPEENGTYLVYAPEYRGGSSRGKEYHDGIMFAIFKAGKWSIEHGYYSRPNCVLAWMPLPEPYEVEE